MPYAKSGSASTASPNPPSNQSGIWIDNSSGNNVPKIFDMVNKQWVIIQSQEVPKDTEALDQLKQLKIVIQNDIDLLSNEINSMDNTEELNNLRSILDNLINEFGDTVQNYYTIEQSNRIFEEFTTKDYMNNEISKKANILDHFNKTEVISLLDEKADKSLLISEMKNKVSIEDVYTQNETRILIQAYVNADEPNYEPIDMSVYYTKSQASDIFMPKSDLSIYVTNEHLVQEISIVKNEIKEAVSMLRNELSLSNYYSKEEVYSQPQIDAKLMPFLQKTELVDALRGYATSDTFYTKIESDTRYISKGELIGYVTNDQLSEKMKIKADAVLHYSKIETDAKYALKSDFNDVYKKSETYSQDEISLKLATKADVSSLQEYVKIADMNSSLSKKANALEILSALDLKSNIKDVNQELNLKANISDLNSALSSKANIKDVDNALLLKANSKDVSTSLDLKANTSDVYSKSEVVNMLAGKSNSNHTHANIHSSYLLGTKTVDESKVSDKRILAFNAATGKLEYATVTVLNLLGAQIGTLSINFN